MIKSRTLKLHRFAGAGALLGILCTPFSSATPVGQARPSFEITPFGGYCLGGSLSLDDPSYKRVDFADGGVYGIAVGVGVAPPDSAGDGALELMWTHQDSALKAQPNPGIPDISVNMNVDQFHLNGLYLPPDFKGVRPYVIAGLGATRYAPVGDVSSLTLFSWALGGGIKVPLTQHLSVRVEAKWDPALASASASVFCNSSTGRCFVASSGNLINQFDFTAGLSLRL